MLGYVEAWRALQVVDLTYEFRIREDHETAGEGIESFRLNDRLYAAQECVGTRKSVGNVLVQLDYHACEGAARIGRSSPAEAAANAMTAHTASPSSVGKSFRISATLIPSAKLATLECPYFLAVADVEPVAIGACQRVSVSQLDIRNTMRPGPGAFPCRIRLPFDTPPRRLRLNCLTTSTLSSSNQASCRPRFRLDFENRSAILPSHRQSRATDVVQSRPDSVRTP